MGEKFRRAAWKSSVARDVEVEHRRVIAYIAAARRNEVRIRRADRERTMYHPRFTNPEDECVEPLLRVLSSSVYWPAGQTMGESPSLRALKKPVRCICMPDR